MVMYLSNYLMILAVNKMKNKKPQRFETFIDHEQAMINELCT